MRNAIIIIAVCIGILAFADNKNLVLHSGGNALYTKTDSLADSIKFNGGKIIFNLRGNDTDQFSISGIDSLTFEDIPAEPIDSTYNPNEIYIIYNNDTATATIINPYSTQGITITACTQAELILPQALP